MGHPLNAQIALAHFSFCRELRCPEWTDHGAAMATYARIFVHVNDPTVGIPEDGL
jgi:hypothetical protein